ncbi:hypothetical protein BSN82_16500 [Acinetobacter baylyi]|uniref:Uncharacterized protein n=1 Tax=Acinetobacter baylyi (strain ATCC 33305 / BD413 / ADP1) TaxID=62977 RepID=Q6F6M8_ACIAD|nr:hypothetical protein BSL88_14735 [Acinetobacter baylyi]MAK31145.1 hypothetical protein [Acinetobacter sp.]CAG70289.1 hypothetical protein ACIAD3660 [Acinetobacter baylyi ADP1]KAF2372205.1 hypothetical protein BSL67_13730 [Acinetobacter baylyi]KAF2376435.1 hypothetical protein BSN81_13130 [Acinetobacter baylyi]
MMPCQKFPETLSVNADNVLSEFSKNFGDAEKRRYNVAIIHVLLGVSRDIPSFLLFTLWKCQ